ncbi:MAG: porin [Alphaproteobacteria bacterium]|nr:porin [Alphaproteobacteria bacterium]
MRKRDFQSRHAFGLASAVLLFGLGSPVVVNSSAAADFGSDCCLDLEERIAELEATAVGSGNRRVELSISGQVSQAIAVWDDGEETNVYQVGDANSSDRLRFDGRARINQDVAVGLLLEFSLGSPSSAAFDQNNDDTGSFGLNLRQSLWYVRSRRLGSVSMGLAAPSTDDIISYNFGATTIAGSADTRLVGTNLITRDSTLSGPAGLNSLSSGNTISLRWRRFLPQLDTPRGNLVRYDTPVIAGFTASVSWGEDDFWDVAVRHARKMGDFRFAFGAGYYENREEEAFTFGWPRGGDNDPISSRGNTVIRDFKGSASIIHDPTGLFASAAFVHREYAGSDLGVLTFACFSSGDAAGIRASGVACGNRPDFDYFWVSGGIRRQFFSIGKTSIYGEYAHSEDAIGGLNVSVRSAAGGDIDFVTRSEMDIWGLGIVQNIQAAGMDVFFSYRNFSADVSGLESSGRRVSAPIEDTDIFFAGSRIRF